MLSCRATFASTMFSIETAAIVLSHDFLRGLRHGALGYGFSSLTAQWDCSSIPTAS